MKKIKEVPMAYTFDAEYQKKIKAEDVIKGLDRALYNHHRNMMLQRIENNK